LINEDNGLSIQPGNYVALVASLNQLLTNSALVTRLSKTARKTAECNYSSLVVNQAYRDVFVKVVT
jgi:glycosyltransferase involved in cell wall biosynthesis